MDELKLENTLFCPYAWNNVYVSTEGKVGPCCVWEGALPDSVRTSPISRIYNKDTFKSIRVNMLKGKWCEGCDKCRRGEEAGAYSSRLSSLEYYADEFERAKQITEEDGGLTEVKPSHWDIRFSNKCNFKCRMCGPQSSTAWYGDWEKLGRSAHVEYLKRHVNQEIHRKRLVDNVIENLGHLREIYFAGGEPLIMDEHYQILEELIRQGRENVRIRYNTNLSVLTYKNWDVIDLWHQLQDLHTTLEVCISMDAIGPALEYVRKGCSWARMQENIAKLFYEGITFYLAPTISIHNVYRFPEMFKWYFENISEYRWGLPGINLVGYPEFYDLRILPEKEKQKIREHYRNIIDNLEGFEQKEGSRLTLQAIVNYLDEPGGDPRWQKEFFRETKILDNIRGERFLDINPEFTEWWNENN